MIMTASSPRRFDRKTLVLLAGSPHDLAELRARGHGGNNVGGSYWFGHWNDGPIHRLLLKFTG